MTISQLIADLLKPHHEDTSAKLDKVLENQETMKADLLSIKAFFEVPDVRIGATQEQIDALGEKLKQQTDAVKSFDETTTGNAPNPS